MCNSQLVLTQFIDLSGYLLASGDGGLGLWWPQKQEPTLTFTPVNIPLLSVFCWSRGEAGPGVPAPAPCQHWPHTCVPRERNAAGMGHNCSEVTGKVTVTGQQPLLFCRQCWGFLAAEDRLSLPALFHMDLPKGALSRVQHWARFLTQVQSYWKRFSQGLYPLSFLTRLSDWNMHFIPHCYWPWGYKIHGLLYCPTLFCVHRKWGLSLPFRVSSCQDSIPYLKNTEHSTKHHVY